MVLDQHFIAQRSKHAAKHVCRLLDDAGVGDGVDHAPLAMLLGVLQRKGQAGQRLATARGHGEREEARR